MNELLCCFRHLCHGDAEVLVEFRCRSRGAEALHADEHPTLAEPPLPAETDGGLDGDTRRCAQHRIDTTAACTPSLARRSRASMARPTSEPVARIVTSRSLAAASAST